MSTDDILKSLIGAGGAIIGALITVFAPVIIESVRGRRYKWLVGEWKCRWTVTFPVAEEEEINDNVKIEKIAGENVYGTGSGDEGSYRLKGTPD